MKKKHLKKSQFDEMQVKSVWFWKKNWKDPHSKNGQKRVTHQVAAQRGRDLRVLSGTSTAGATFRKQEKQAQSHQFLHGRLWGSLYTPPKTNILAAENRPKRP